MRAGDKIRIQMYIMGNSPLEQIDYTVEEFRHCLGVFLSEDAREAGKFKPLCDLYENGPDSKQNYISNYGEYMTDQVQAWMDLPRD